MILGRKHSIPRISPLAVKGIKEVDTDKNLLPKFFLHEVQKYREYPDERTLPIREKNTK
jgi:hypothetical protein